MVQPALYRQILVRRNHICLHFMASCTFERLEETRQKFGNKEIECHSKEQEAGLSICPNVSELPVYLYSESIYSSSTVHQPIYPSIIILCPTISFILYLSIHFSSIHQSTQNTVTESQLDSSSHCTTVLLQPPQIKLFTYFPHFTFSLLGHQILLKTLSHKVPPWLPDLLVDHELSTM